MQFSTFCVNRVKRSGAATAPLVHFSPRSIFFSNCNFSVLLSNLTQAVRRISSFLRHSACTFLPLNQAEKVGTGLCIY